MTAKPLPSVGVVSLGCAKNLVDTEVMLGHLQRAGHRPIATDLWDVASVRAQIRSIEEESRMLRDNALNAVEGMTFAHVTRATAYFEHPLFKPYFDAWCDARDLGEMPVVAVHADVCRGDLLFELELDACSPAR